MTPKRWLPVLAGLAMLVSAASAQNLRFSNHRDVAIPDYATFRIPPLYSTLVFEQSAGYRWTRTKGTGTEFLFSNRRGTIVEDGSDIPLVSTLTMRNYLPISANAAMDISFTASYEYYPLKTQDDAFNLDVSDEGLLGIFTFEFRPAEDVRMTIYDNARYQTDYVDTRGIGDQYGGSKYVYFSNEIGVNGDWLVGKQENILFGLSRADLLPQEDAFADQESINYTETAGFEKGFGALIMAGVSVDLSQNLYAADTRPDSAQQAGRVYSTAKLTQNSNGRASMGYSQGTVNGDAAADQGTMIGEVGVGTELGRNLKQDVSASRSQQAGFNSGFEVHDTYSYSLGWAGEMVAANAHTRYSQVDPNGTDVNGYSDWTSGVNVSWPMFLRYLIFKAYTTYEVRGNDPMTVPAETDATSDVALVAEQNNDYQTWTSGLGASMAIMKDLKAATDFQHIERFSDAQDLAYTRDVFSVTLTYRYIF